MHNRHNCASIVPGHMVTDTTPRSLEKNGASS